MTTHAGWYPDPHAPHINRWWDGQAWTAHTSAPTAGVATAYNPYAVTLPTPPTRRGPVIAVVVVGILAIVAVVVAVPVVVKQAVQKGPPICGIVAPAGASPEVKAYVSALHDYYRRSESYTQYVNANGGASHLSTPSDYSKQIGIETAFLSALEAIQFTGKPAADAQNVTYAIEKTIQDLNIAMTQSDPDVDARLQFDYSEEINVKLRFDLGLPRYGTCSFWQPT